MQYFASAFPQQKGRYLRAFTLWNLLFLLVLVIAAEPYWAEAFPLAHLFARTTPFPPSGLILCPAHPLVGLAGVEPAVWESKSHALPFGYSPI